MPARRLLYSIAALTAIAVCGPAVGGTFIFEGDSRVEGSGRAVDQARDLAPFTSLQVTGPFDVRLKLADVERATVHADDNIAPLIETRVDDGRLIVGIKRGTSIRTRTRSYVTVEFRRLDSVELTGSADVRADRIDSPIFEVAISGSGDVSVAELRSDAIALSISGSGDIRIAGRADKLGASIVGSGDVLADQLEAREVAVRIRGSGDARVSASETLKVDIAGSGDVRYRGSPNVTHRVAGSGEVSPF